VAHALMRAAPALVPAFPLLLVFTSATLHAQGAVEGKVVTTTNGAPIHKAMVLLRPARIVASNETRPRDSYLTQSDSNGRFSITGMVAGTYECVPSRTGFGAQPPDAAPSPKYFPLVKIEDGKTTQDVVVKLTPLGVIYGRVLDAEGDPVSHAVVEASVDGYAQGKRQREQRGLNQTNDRGEYRIYNLFPGKYYLEAMVTREPQFYGAELRGPRPLMSSSTFYPSTVDEAQAAPVEVLAGGELGSLDIHLQRIRVFAIRGKMPPPDPKYNYAFNALRRSPNQMRAYYGGFVTLQRDRQWEIAGLEPGSYVVTMTRFESNAGRVANPQQQQRQEALVEIVDHDVEGVEFSSTIAAEVTGVLKSTGAKPVNVERMQVSLSPANPGPNFLSAAVKADGSFSISNVPPDIYTVRVEPAANAYPVSIKFGSKELTTGEIDLRGGGGALAIVVSSDFSEVEGKVTDADGNPDPSANVTFVPDQKRADWAIFFKSQLADSQGHFLLRNIPPGTYTVFAWKDAPRNAPRDPDFRKPYEKQGVTMTLEAGSHQTVDLKSIVTQQ